ncbi:hypothetical protein J1N35_007949 [Gossypium stocksii]|uniref:Uncharacterized protein n=1 Tax=Gossypium stocksii TaxID=47602 RepID=A0A9D4AG55_9ROSI|nr:hypothetical protein J1N35_007949 [Gossypium stocksii]
MQSETVTFRKSLRAGFITLSRELNLRVVHVILLYKLALGSYELGLVNWVYNLALRSSSPCRPLEVES